MSFPRLLLSACLVALSPGLTAYEAAAATFGSRPGEASLLPLPSAAAAAPRQDGQAGLPQTALPQPEAQLEGLEARLQDAGPAPSASPAGPEAGRQSLAEAFDRAAASAQSPITTVDATALPSGEASSDAGQYPPARLSPPAPTVRLPSTWRWPPALLAAGLAASTPVLWWLGAQSLQSSLAAAALAGLAAAASAAMAALGVETALAQPSSATILHQDKSLPTLRVALVGDSVSRNTYATAPLKAAWMARNERLGGWFLDPTPYASGGESLFLRLGRLAPIAAINHAGPGAWLEGVNRSGSSVYDSLLKVDSMQKQIGRILDAREFPHLVLLWIGHNNLDWAAELSPERRRRPDEALQRIASDFVATYVVQLDRLLGKARARPQRVSIVVYALGDTGRLFEARKAIEDSLPQLRRQDPGAYPYLETFPRRFVSGRPEHRAATVRLRDMINARLKTAVAGIKAPSNVQLRYSESLAGAAENDPRFLHPMDAWHPSERAQSSLAEAALKDLQKEATLEFLGVSQEEKP